MSVAVEVSPIVATAEASPSRPDHRGSWIPNGRMIAAKILELRKRHGLMTALVAVDIGLPTAFLAVRLISHAVDPKAYGPAGGAGVFGALVSGPLYVFGFIVAATLGCTAGSSDLSDGVFRHLVVTGRSRLALYLARIPAGLAILVPLVAVGFDIVCSVCVFAAPTTLSYQGVTVPPALSAKGFESWAEGHYGEVVCQFQYPPSVVNVNVPCGPNGQFAPKAQLPSGLVLPPVAQLKADAAKIAEFDYRDYRNAYLSPPVSLMVESGLWLELEALVGFVVGLGLASLLGQRTVAVILMIVLEIIITPLASRVSLPHFTNLIRAVPGLATGRLEPSALPPTFGGNAGGGPGPVENHVLALETTKEAIFVIVCWVVVWSAVGAWRMKKRDV
jgi:hypothetical protein